MPLQWHDRLWQGLQEGARKQGLECASVHYPGVGGEGGVQTEVT